MKKAWHKGKEGEDEEDCEPCQALKIFKNARPFSQPAQTQTQGAQSTHAQATQHTQHTQPSSQQTTTSTQQKASTLQETPPDLQELGRSTWTLLHTIAAYYPENPSETKKESVREFITDISKVFPCNECATDFQGVIKDTPPNVNSRKDLALWMCQAHNHVNERLGKETFDCSKVDERWRYEYNKDK